MIKDEQIYGNTKNPKQLMMLLHGYGSSGEDLISLAPEFIQALPNAVFISPNAPYRCEQMFWSGNSYQWFSLINYDMSRILKEVDESFNQLKAYTDKMLKKFNLSNKNLIMSGFSQGAMMSIHYGLNIGEKILGVVAFSGRILSNQTRFDESQITDNFIAIHGKNDMVVPFYCLKEIEDGLLEIGKKPKTLAVENLPHSIDETGIEFAKKFLKKIAN